jgi:hypothetical protein
MYLRLEAFRHSIPGGLQREGCIIQIMPLTWDSLLLPVNGQAHQAHDLTGSTSGLRRGSPSKT